VTDFNLPWLRDWWGHAFEFRAEPDGKCVAIRRDDRGERVADSWPGLKRVIEDEWAERPVDKAAWVDQLTGQRGLSHLSRAGQAPAGLTPPPAGAVGRQTRWGAGKEPWNGDGHA
jgi:hypothetical protein